MISDISERAKMHALLSVCILTAGRAAVNAAC